MSGIIASTFLGLALGAASAEDNLPPSTLMYGLYDSLPTTVGSIPKKEIEDQGIEADGFYHTAAVRGLTAVYRIILALPKEGPQAGASNPSLLVFNNYEPAVLGSRHNLSDGADDATCAFVRAVDVRPNIIASNEFAYRAEIFVGGNKAAAEIQKASCLAIDLTYSHSY